MYLHVYCACAEYLRVREVSKVMESKSDLEAVLCSSGDLTAMMCDAADFISRYQWIWDVQMTKFFQLQHWNKIPSEVRFYTIDSRDIT